MLDYSLSRILHPVLVDGPGDSAVSLTDEDSLRMLVDVFGMNQVLFPSLDYGFPRFPSAQLDVWSET